MRIELHLGVCVLLVALGSATAGEWKPKRAVPLRLKARTVPATGETEAWMVKALAPAGRRFLALVEHQRNKLSAWVDEQALREDIKRQGYIGADKLAGARFHDELLLMLINENGRVIAQSSPHAEITHWAGLFPNSRAVPLVMEEAETCQYGLLEPQAKKVFCFDLQLGFQRSVDIPLDIPMVPGVTREGNEYSLFFFGWKFGQVPLLSRWDQLYDMIPERPESLGAVWKVGAPSMAPLVVSPSQLWQAVARVARGPQGEKLKVQQAGLAIHPIQRLAPTPDLGVLITAISSSDYARYVRFEGVRLFFRASLTQNGMSQVVQLPFWVVQEEGRKEAEVDADTGTLFLPSFADLENLRAFEFKPNHIGLSLVALYKLPREDGSYDLRVWDDAKFFVTFSGRELGQVYEFDEAFREQAAKVLSTRETKTYPVKLWGMVGPSLFAFHGVAISGEENEESRFEQCVVLVELWD